MNNVKKALFYYRNGYSASMPFYSGIDAEYGHGLRKKEKAQNI